MKIKSKRLKNNIKLFIFVIIFSYSNLFSKQCSDIFKLISLQENVKLLNSNFKKPIGKKLKFLGVKGYDVYNITAPFILSGHKYIAGRVEARTDEKASKVMFFKNVKNNGQDEWHLVRGITFDLQDPFITKVDDEFIFGGVLLELDSNGNIKSYTTDFYRGTDLTNLKHFASGPVGMKDIRIVKLHNGKIGVFTRPQGEIGGIGKIGFIVIDSLNALTPEIIKKAPLIKDLEEMFGELIWGGVNAAYQLSSEQIGVLQINPIFPLGNLKVQERGIKYG